MEGGLKMKNIQGCFLLGLLAFFCTSCFNEVEGQLAALERRVAFVEQKVATMTENIQSLQVLAEKYQSYIYVDSFRAIYSGKDITGYRLYFSDGQEIVLNNSITEEDPIIGLKFGTDGFYYWTITIDGVTDYVYDDYGQKVAASVLQPIVKIENNNWKISFDGGGIWKTYGSAMAQDGKSFVESVVEEDGYLNIYLLSGEVLTFPTYDLYEDYLDQIYKLGNDLDALIQIYDAKKNNLFVRTVVPIVENTDTVGYEMVLNNSTSISVYDGKSSDPVKIGLKQHTDGLYYWAMNDEDGNLQWLKDDIDRMVLASPKDGLTPIFMLDNSLGDGKYYWTYKYGENGRVYWLYDSNNQKIEASPKASIAVFSSIEVNENFISLSTLSGESFTLPRYKTFTITLADRVVFEPSDTSLSLTYKVSDVPVTVAITALAKDGYYAGITKSYNASLQVLSGKITITASPGAAANSTLLVLVSDGCGHMKTHEILIEKQ